MYSNKGKEDATRQMKCSQQDCSSGPLTRAHLLHPRPPARMHTSILVIAIRATRISTGVSPGRLVVLLLVFLDLLRGTLALVVELLVLGLDLGLSVFRIGTAAAGARVGF